jgi:hypothetical protein
MANPMGAGATQGAPPRRAMASWWERTEGARASPPGSRRVFRSDASRAQVQSVAVQIDAGIADTLTLLGPLRPRSMDPLHGLVFVLRDDFLDTLRVKFAVNGVAPGHAFSSPLGRGIACVVEDVPPPEVVRAVRAAAVDETCAVAMGAELAPWLVAGTADAVARRASAPLGARPMMVGAAALGAVRDALDRSQPRELARTMMGQSLQDYAAEAQPGNAARHELSASLVRFVSALDQRDRGSRLVRIARAINDGAEPGVAASDALGLWQERDWNAFGESWSRFAASEAEDPRQTALERLAFLAEGLRVMRSEGEEPRDFAALAASLTDRKFAWPLAACPGWSTVRASSPASFAVPGGSWPIAVPPSGGRVAPGPRFVLESAPGGLASVATEGLEGGDLRVEWLATRPEPEAPLVWEIVRKDGPPRAPRRPQPPPP